MGCRRDACWGFVLGATAATVDWLLGGIFFGVDILFLGFILGGFFGALAGAIPIPKKVREKLEAKK
jgi:hypothetical protein